MRRHSRLSIGGVLCGLAGPGTIRYSWDGGIEQNCQVCWAHNRLQFPVDCRGVSWPCQRVSCSLPHDARKENRPIHRWRARDCFFVSAFISLGAELQLRVTPWFVCRWWLPGLSVTTYILHCYLLFPNSSGSLIPRVLNNNNNNNVLSILQDGNCQPCRECCACDLMHNINWKGENVLSHVYKGCSCNALHNRLRNKSKLTLAVW